MVKKQIESPEEFSRYKSELVKHYSEATSRILLCMTGCRAKGAIALGERFRDEISSRGLEGRVAVVDVGCHGQCSRAPLIRIEPQEYLYGKVAPDDVPEIIEKTILSGQPVERLCVKIGNEVYTGAGDQPFFRIQKRKILDLCGRIDPKSIEEAIAYGSYSAVNKAFTTMSPEEIVSTVKSSGLRGRGGAGFPTGIKWGFARDAAGTEKYIVCNADEGDPGAFMDRALLEGTPHQVIEGMILAAYAIGANRGFIYVRMEYPIAVDHVTKAIADARELGLLGENLLGSGFSFDIEIRKGAGAFVCGEETALIASLEGKRGMPRPRPPFPAVSGFHGKPTNINNVETLANVPIIVLNGADRYSSLGSEGGRGTKIFALAGKVRETGLVEVPMGVSLRDIVFGVGGGPLKGRKFKAAQIGGPSGGCVPAEHLDLKIDYESVKEVGAIMGSGGLVVMDDRTCMVDVARFFLEFTRKESCGTCVPCRVGTKHLVDILTRICEGKGQKGDIHRLEELANDVKAGSLCGLGQTAPNPVLSTLQYFRDEYEAHINEKRCPAGVCKDLITFSIEPDRCIGCQKCAKSCPVDAIIGEAKMPHVIDSTICISCGNCREVCPVDAVNVR